MRAPSGYPREAWVLLPLAAGHLDATILGLAELRLQPLRLRRHDIVRPGSDGRLLDRRAVLDALHVTDADRLASKELKLAEVLKADTQACPPLGNVEADALTRSIKSHDGRRMLGYGENAFCCGAATPV